MVIEVIDKFADDPQVLFIGGAFMVAIVGIMFGTISGVIRTLARERTRREIAAYIAEGSMTPEQGERLLKASKSECED